MTGLHMNWSNLKAFVTDGDERPALAITRSLGRRGVSVLVGAESPASLASSSRYCDRHVTYPSPYRSPEAFDRFVQELVERERLDLVVPVSDVTTHLVARRQNALRRHAAVAAPSFNAFDTASNKWCLMQRAAQCGIPIPRTHFVNGLAGLQAQLAEIEYPAVIKPARSRMRSDEGWLAGSVHYAHGEAELLRLYRTIGYLTSFPSLIQECIVGSGIGVFVLCDHGRLVTAFAHRRLREKPPSGGVSVLCESVAVDPELCRQAMRLLGPLGWHGVAMMEFKQDRRTGRPVLIEVNGRFWGSLQLAIDAGVDFPFLASQLALGQPPDVPPIYKVGLKSRWLLGDLDHLLIRLLHGDRDLADTAPSKLRALCDFLEFFAPSVRYDVWRRDDPRPALRELRHYMKSSFPNMTPAAQRLSTDVVAARPSAAIGPLDLCRALAQKAIDRGARAVRRGVERRRMNRIRRNPAELRRALRSAERLLVMCYGNIIRSPFATQLLRQALAGRSPVTVMSAGLGAQPGNPAHPTALRAASARSVDLTSHHASAIAPERVSASDVIFVMEVSQIAAVRERFPDASRKTFLLTCLAPELPLEIADPIDRDEAAYHVCYEHIARAVRPIIRTLVAAPVAQPHA